MFSEEIILRLFHKAGPVYQVNAGKSISHERNDLPADCLAQFRPIVLHGFQLLADTLAAGILALALHESSGQMSKLAVKHLVNGLLHLFPYSGHCATALSISIDVKSFPTRYSRHAVETSVPIETLKPCDTCLPLWQRPSISQ